jgi:hypothetical protein
MTGRLQNGERISICDLVGSKDHAQSASSFFTLGISKDCPTGFGAIRIYRLGYPLVQKQDGLALPTQRSDQKRVSAKSAGSCLPNQKGRTVFSSRRGTETIVRSGLVFSTTYGRCTSIVLTAFPINGSVPRAHHHGKPGRTSQPAHNGPLFLMWC